MEGVYGRQFALGCNFRVLELFMKVPKHTATATHSTNAPLVWECMCVCEWVFYFRALAV